MWDSIALRAPSGQRWQDGRVKTETVLAMTGMGSTALLGMAGIIATAVTSSKGRAAAKELADTARVQQRLADAYIDLLKYVEAVGRWAQLVRPVSDTSPPRTPPALPEPDVEHIVRAKVFGYASAEVRKLYETWISSVVEIRKADHLIGLRLDAQDRHSNYQPKEGDQTDWLDHLTPWGELEDKLRPAELEARASLIAQVSNELR